MILTLSICLGETRLLLESWCCKVRLIWSSLCFSVGIRVLLLRSMNDIFALKPCLVVSRLRFFLLWAFLRAEVLKFEFYCQGLSLVSLRVWRNLGKTDFTGSKEVLDMSLYIYLFLESLIFSVWDWKFWFYSWTLMVICCFSRSSLMFYSRTDMFFFLFFFVLVLNDWPSSMWDLKMLLESRFSLKMSYSTLDRLIGCVSISGDWSVLVLYLLSALASVGC